MSKKAINTVLLTAVIGVVIGAVYYFGKQAVHFIIKMHGGS
jgi:hypothetical protein